MCVWSTITPGAYFLLPSLLEVLQGISRRALPWGWEASGGAVRVRRNSDGGDAHPSTWVLPLRTALAEGSCRRCPGLAVV